MSDLTEEYGKRHLARHLFEAGTFEDLLELAERQQKRIDELEKLNQSMPPNRPMDYIQNPQKDND
jgi:hypothetical protein